jgi:hypothetical protein
MYANRASRDIFLWPPFRSVCVRDSDGGDEWKRGEGVSTPPTFQSHCPLSRLTPCVFADGRLRSRLLR